MKNGAVTYAEQLIEAVPPPRFERVLFPTDFSEISLSALPFAASVARTFQSELKLLHVLVPGEYVFMVPEITSDVSGVIERDADARLLALKYSAELRGVRVGLPEVFTGGFRLLPEKIAADAIDLVVIATHGSKGLRHMLLGSVAEDVIHTASCPVLTIGPKAAKTHDAEFRPKHIVFATDACVDSFRALPYAIQLAQRQCSDLTLVLVLSREHPGTPEAEAFASLMREGLRRGLPLTAIKACNPEIVVSFGNTVEQILNAARERGSELIVMGARSSTKRPTFSHSVSYGVISRATCPVLTIRGAR
jgi:nucleotide-binding universal stress UspA family protein